MQNNFEQTVKKALPKIICIGKNYLEHVKQMGGIEFPKEPSFFIKPWTSLAYNPSHLSLPISKIHRIDHEVELGVVIGKPGKKIAKNEVQNHIKGYFLALDLTDRDLQKIAKTNGSPWQLSKGQDNFCPVSKFIPSNIDPYSVLLTIEINGVVKQKDYTKNMNFKIDQIVSYVSQYMTLTEGDLILTGTPNGVGPITVGDKVVATAQLENQNIAELRFQVTQ